MAFRPEALGCASSTAAANRPAVDETAAFVGEVPAAMTPETAAAEFALGATPARTRGPAARMEQPAKGPRRTPGSKAASFFDVSARGRRFKAREPPAHRASGRQHLHTRCSSNHSGRATDFCCGKSIHTVVAPPLAYS